MADGGDLSPSGAIDRVPKKKTSRRGGSRRKATKKASSTKPAPVAQAAPDPRPVVEKPADEVVVQNVSSATEYIETSEGERRVAPGGLLRISRSKLGQRTLAKLRAGTHLKQV